MSGQRPLIGAQQQNTKHALQETNTESTRHPHIKKHMFDEEEVE
jgi:hypothetical protein